MHIDGVGWTWAFGHVVYHHHTLILSLMLITAIILSFISLLDMSFALLRLPPPPRSSCPPAASPCPIWLRPGRVSWMCWWWVAPWCLLLALLSVSCLLLVLPRVVLACTPCGRGRRGLMGEEIRKFLEGGWGTTRRRRLPRLSLHRPRRALRPVDATLVLSLSDS